MTRKLALKVPAVTRDLYVNVMAQFRENGAPIGEPVVMARASLVYCGPVDELNGPFYVLGVTEPLHIDPPVKFSEYDKALATDLGKAVDLGKVVRWGVPPKKRARKRKARKP